VVKGLSQPQADPKKMRFWMEQRFKAAVYCPNLKV
jgi:hypothetical protein